MSEARRAADALATAHESVKAALTAIGKHCHRGHSDPVPQHITDLRNLAWANETLHYLARDLGEFAKVCADDVRVHYVHGKDHGGPNWPVDVTAAAADADTALSKLRGYLRKTPIAASHTALGNLYTCVRNTRRRSTT